MLYVGDDPTIDGGLAERARVPYLYVPFVHEGFQPNRNRGQLLIPDFRLLHEVLASQSEKLRSGESFASILFNMTDRELFPPLPEDRRPVILELRSRGRREIF